ncbi:hypothetical protein [Agrobacterium tumefaciens]|uniref:hypothetical protein n=1 Tax=Agrobacterium tumefaciens TaxID=358 RepID=UPI0032E3B85D
MIGVDAIFANDRENAPTARSLPWEETRGSITVVVEPKPHWAADMRAFWSTKSLLLLRGLDRERPQRSLLRASGNPWR